MYDFFFTVPTAFSDHFYWERELLFQEEAPTAELPSSQPQLVVWGTDVAVAECREKFLKFIQRFVEPTALTNEPLYEIKLEEVSIELLLKPPLSRVACFISSKSEAPLVRCVRINGL